MPNDLSFPQHLAREKSRLAFSEIVQLLPDLRTADDIDQLLKAIAATCEANSQLEGDDMELCAQRIEECRESLTDEIGTDADDAESVRRLEDRARARDMARAK